VEFRLIDSGITDTARTMAVDETVLETFERCGIRTLHLYRRRPPAVSLGYFQSARTDIDAAFCRENGISICRRSSGGGAIFCDENQLIYAVTFYKKELPKATGEALRMVSAPLVETLRSFGLPAVFAPVNDITVNGKKISGCAQLRRREVVLQHGTLLMKNDRERMFRALRVPAKKTARKGLEHPGDRVTDLFSELARVPGPGEIVTGYLEEFEKAFHCRVKPGELAPHEKRRVEELVREKYGNPEWNLKR